MSERTASSILSGVSSAHMASLARWLAQAAFGLWLLLALTTSSWRYGPFSWWPLCETEHLAGGPASLGLLNLLPLLATAGWLHRRLLVRDFHWQLGQPALTLPFLALSLLGLLSLAPLPDRLAFIYSGSLLLAWLVYLVVLNERPVLGQALAAVIVIQTLVALGQFLFQHDLGLSLLGELPLDPAGEGTSVLAARGRPWLRAYGLLAHPNLLGALLTALLLFLLPLSPLGKKRPSAGSLGHSGWWKPVFAFGLLGLFVSFSRASWLALAAGLLFALWLRLRPTAALRPNTHRTRQALWLLLPALLLLFFYHDLAVGRLLALDTPLEAHSISERLRDAGLALEVIARSPWRGVGLGRYVQAAAVFDPAAARVHNVTLLVTAELGFPGLFLWLLLALAPFYLAWRGRLDPAGLPPWLAMLVINLFDTMLWWGSNWQTAILFGLLLANLHRPAASAAPGTVS